MSTVHERLGPDFPAEHTFILFKNINGTCFVNSVLQALYSVPAIQEFIREWDATLAEHEMKQFVEDVYQMPFGHFLKIYIDSMNAPQNEVWYEPTYFLDRVFENEQRYTRGSQYDAFEFFTFLVNSIDQSTHTFVEVTGNRLMKYFRSLFEFTVTGRITSPLEAYDCPAETMVALSIGQCTRPRLQENIEQWMSRATMHGQLQRRFMNLPPVLAIVMSSYELDEAKGEYVKFFSHMEMQDTIRLVESGPGYERGVFYELCGIVAHNGGNIHEGHYTCIIKACDRWVVADDENLYGPSEDELHEFFLHQRLPGYDSLAVTMLIYQRLGEA